MIVFAIIVILSIFLDQLVKWWTVSNIEFGETIFHNPILSLTHIRNEGAAWSILEGKMWFLYIVTVITVCVISYYLYQHRHESKWLTIGLSLILGGAFGNFIDRVRMGYVVDMFQLELFNFPIFNIADISLVIGVLCVLIYILIDEKEKKVS